MNSSSQGAAQSGPSAGGPSRRTATPPTLPRQSPQPSQTPPMPASRPASSHKAQKQTSFSQLNARAMNSAKSFESTKSRRSNDSLTARLPRTADTPPPLPNPKEELLKVLQSQFDGLRHVITCKICFGLMYEPYTTACGHTYCYVCFCKSFQPNQTPACPECRGKLANPPAPAYAVREMTHAFIAKQELLPEGETLEQHKGWQKEHAEIVLKDKNNKNPRDGGLWRGFFRPRRPRMFPIHDYEDGVDRCPICTWELEDGMCNRCGLPIDENGEGQWGEFSDIASEHPSMMSGHDIVIEEDYDVEDDFIDDEEGDWDEYDGMQYAEDMTWGQPFTIQRMLGGHPSQRRNNRLASHSAAGSRSRYSASVHESEMGTLEEEDEDEDSSMSGFVVGDDEGIDYTRDSTPASDSPSRSSRFPESIAEDDEEEDDVPIAPGRRRIQSTMSSTPTITNSVPNASHSRPQQIASQTNRRRRVISETPSTESTSSASAAAEDDEDDVPIAAASRRRRRPLSQEEPPTRRVRPRARTNSIPEDDAGLDPWGYRPLGTPQVGEDGEDEQSDGGRTEVGWEPITHPNARLQGTGSLTPTADRPSTPPRPASRNSISISRNNTFPLGSRGIRRRSSVVSVVHYEDNDADGESDTQQGAGNGQPALETRSSRTRLRNVPSQQAINRILAPSHIIDNEDTDSGDTETSPQAGRRGDSGLRQRDPNPYIRMLLAEHRTEVQSSEPEAPVYAEFEHLRGISRTPVARPRTSNRNRATPVGHSTIQNGMGNAGTPVRSMQQVYSPSRFRAAPDSVHSATHANSRTFSGLAGSPRNSISGPSNGSTRSRVPGEFNAPTRYSLLSQQTDERLQAYNTALLRSLQNTTPGSGAAQNPRHNMASGVPPSPRAPQMNDYIERPISRISTRNGYIVQHGPANIARPTSNSNRPPSTGGSRRSSLTRSPFAPPQVGPPGIGLGTARAWHPTNPFFNGVVRRQPSRNLQHQGSNSTLRGQRSIRVLRVQGQAIPIPAAEPEPDRLSPHRLAPSASRMHLRPQPSYRRIQIQRDPNTAQYQQQSAASTSVPVPQAQAPARTSPSGNSTLSEDERVQRARELVERRMRELAQGQQARPARGLSEGVQRVIDERLAASMGRAAAGTSQASGGGVGGRQTGQPTSPTLSGARGASQQAALSNSSPVLNRPAAPTAPTNGSASQVFAGRVQNTQLPTQQPSQQPMIRNPVQSHQPFIQRVATEPPPARHPMPGVQPHIQRVATQQPSSRTSAPNTVPTAPNNEQPTHRTPVEQQQSRASALSMAQGVTAITTGGDIRRN